MKNANDKNLYKRTVRRQQIQRHFDYMKKWTDTKFTLKEIKDSVRSFEERLQKDANRYYGW